MKRNPYSAYSLDRRRWIFPLSIFGLLLIIFVLALAYHKPANTFPNQQESSDSDEIGQQLSVPKLPRFAFLISGSKGDAAPVKRLLQAVYHPRNYYLLHLDLEASDAERLEIARYVKSERAIREFGNVMVIGKADLVTYKGPTVVASMLHAIAILLKMAADWDWFINLSASDYPLMPQDDMLHIFSYLPRDLNFLEHTSNLGWKEHQRARPIIIDPGLYHAKKSGVFWAKEKRAVPASFKLYMGSEWAVLARPFLEFCVWGWDNLPRTLLMYYTNFVSSPEGYFHTVACNHKDYQNTTVNHGLHYIKWDSPPKQRPVSLTLEHLEDMARSGVPFAREFARDDPVLNRIDQDLLKRADGRFTPGGWCGGTSFLGKDPCGVYGSLNAVKPTLSSKRLEKLMLQLIDSGNFRSKQCK